MTAAREACASRAAGHSASGALTVAPPRLTTTSSLRIGLPWRPTVSREAVTSDIHSVQDSVGLVYPLGITTPLRGDVPGCQAASRLGPIIAHSGLRLSAGLVGLSGTGLLTASKLHDGVVLAAHILIRAISCLLTEHP